MNWGCWPGAEVLCVGARVTVYFWSIAVCVGFGRLFGEQGENSPALQDAGGILLGEMECRGGCWSLGPVGGEGQRDTVGCPAWICPCTGGGLGQPKSGARMTHARGLQII